MAMLILSKKPDLVPWEAFREVYASEQLGREYVLPNHYLGLEMRARGNTPEFAGAAYQLRPMGREWPQRWEETRDLAGEVHRLGFDLPGPQRAPRTFEAMQAFATRCDRVLKRLGVDGWQPAYPPRQLWLASGPKVDVEVLR